MEQATKPIRTTMLPELHKALSEFPECPNLLDNPFSLQAGKACSWISERLGRVYPVSKARCNLICKMSGPYCGKEPTNPQKFIKEALIAHSQIINRTFYEKIVKKYQLPTDIDIPEEYPTIKESLSDLWTMKGFNGLLLTGSCIVKNLPKPPKDYDIVLSFDTLENVINQAEIINDLPKTINGVKCDYFYYLGENPDLYFVSLDCDKKILYTSQWFELNLKSLGEGITVIHKSPPMLTGIIESFFNPQEIRELVDAKPKLKSCCGK